MKQVNEFELHGYSNKELAAMFELDVKTFRKNIKNIMPRLGKRIGRKWSIRQVAMILEHMDHPYLIVCNEHLSSFQTPVPKAA